MSNRKHSRQSEPNARQPQAAQPASAQRADAQPTHAASDLSLGAAPSPAVHAVQLSRLAPRGARHAAAKLQRTYGNQYAGQVANAAPLVIQPKLTVTAPDDQYEQEADRVAGQVMRKLQSGAVQRAPENEDEAQVMRKDVGATSGGMSVPSGVESAIQSARGSGQPLPAATRTAMEGAIGADFSGVRVHTDGPSHALNDALSARAFTTGQDIFFRGGEYAPGNGEGQRLLAHELTHVVQQGLKRTHTTVQRVKLTSEEAERVALAKSFWKNLDKGKQSSMPDVRPRQKAMGSKLAVNALGIVSNVDGGTLDINNSVEKKASKEELVEEPTLTDPQNAELWDGTNLKDKSLAGVDRKNLEGHIPGNLTDDELEKIKATAKYTHLKPILHSYLEEYAKKAKQSDTFNTKYLKDLGRELFRLEISHGTITRRKDNFNTQNMHSHWAETEIKASTPYEEQRKEQLNDGSAMYVMDPNGIFYAGSNKDKRFHHSSLLAAGPVAGAGEMSVVNGVLKRITNSSGHYMPDLLQMLQVLKELVSQGVMLKGVKLNLKFKDMNLAKIPESGVPFDDAAEFYEKIAQQGNTTEDIQLRGGVIQHYHARNLVPSASQSNTDTAFELDPNTASQEELENALEANETLKKNLENMSITKRYNRWSIEIGYEYAAIAYADLWRLLQEKLTVTQLREKLKSE